MNVERILELVAVLIEDEAARTIQKKLTQVQGALAALVGNLQDSNAQLQVSQKLADLRQTLAETEAEYDPAFRERMAVIGALPYFTQAMADRLETSIRENAMTPAVANNDAQALVAERAAFITNVKNLHSGLTTLGFDEDDIQEGEAEIGFQLPRKLFDNELDGLTKELNEIKFIIRAFSELSGNAGEAIQVRQISTSDPIFFFGLAIFTIHLLGSAVKWSLDQWKTVEDIRNLRAQTANLQSGPTADKILANFDDLIDERIKSAVAAESAKLVGASSLAENREKELLTHVGFALQGILARVERGMTVEIRLGPPVERPEAGEEEQPGDRRQMAFDEIQCIQSELVFPKITGEPVLSIPSMKRPEDEGAQDSGGSQ